MEWLSGWMSNLIIFLLAAFLLELLLPSSSMQKYARLVLSFILMLLIIEPLVSLTNSQSTQQWEQQLLNFSYADQAANSIEIQWEQKKNEIEDGQDAYISKQVSNQLVQEVEETLIERWGWGIKEIETEWEGEEIQEMDQIMVRLVLEADKSKEEKTSIEPVHIQVDDSTKEKAAKESKKEQEILSYLRDTWGMEEHQIELHLIEEGG